MQGLDKIHTKTHQKRSKNDQKRTNMEKYEEMKKVVADMEKDIIFFYDKQNATAGTRARQAYLAIQKLTKEGRVDIQNKKTEHKEKKDTEKQPDNGEKSKKKGKNTKAKADPKPAKTAKTAKTAKAEKTAEPAKTAESADSDTE